MLVKKELLTISHDIPVQIVDLPKCGKVLAVRLNNIGGKPCTFYSDGVNYIYRYDGEWTKSQIIEYYYSHRENYLDKEINENPELKALVKEFLKNTDSWSDKIVDSIGRFTYYYNADKRWVARHNKANLQKKHLAMFPALPDDFTEWCEAELMKGKYLFFSNKTKGKRTVYCTHCRTTYEETADIRHKTEGQCKHCGTHATYHAQRYHHTVEEKHLASICSRKDDVLLLATHGVVRSFNSELQPIYSIGKEENILIFPHEKKNKIYKYALKNIWGACDWYRYINEMSAYQTKLYDRNLAEVIPAHYLGDVQHVLKTYTGTISTNNLLINLTLIPEAEYLLKMRMIQLAASAHKIVFKNGRGFAGVMGVPAQYKTMYQQLDITVTEHAMLCKVNSPVNENQIRLMRKYGLTSVTSIEALTEKYHISLDKALNYMKKQMSLLAHKHMDETMRYWIDYLDMAEQEHVLTNDSKFPVNLKTEHDLLVDMVNDRKNRELAEKHRREAEEAAQRLAALEKIASRCQTKKYVIQIPKTADDLAREGQALHHCVGNGHYWNRHANGSSLICFIRKKSEPDTPYFTMEVDLRNDKYTITQIQGYYNRVKADKELERFAQRFVNMIQPKSAKVAV